MGHTRQQALTCCGAEKMSSKDCKEHEIKSPALYPNFFEPHISNTCLVDTLSLPGPTSGVCLAYAICKCRNMSGHSGNKGWITAPCWTRTCTNSLHCRAGRSSSRMLLRTSSSKGS